MADIKESFVFFGVNDQAEHWYYHHKINAIELLLSKHLATLFDTDKFQAFQVNRQLRCLDIGAGNGIISRSISKRIDNRLVTWDLVDSAYNPEELGTDSSDTSIALFANIPAGEVYDVILAIDVVEHIRNDQQFLDLLKDHMKSNGLIIICVPAFQLLWSSHDIYLEHYRRYRKRNLTLIMRRSNLKILESGYFYVLLFPLVAIIRILKRLATQNRTRSLTEKSDLSKHPYLINYCLRKLMTLERRATAIFPILGQFFGISCYGVGIKIASNVENQPYQQKVRLSLE